MRILHVLATIDPRSGGPSQGVRQYGSHAEQLGQCIEVLTLDAPDEAFVKDFPLTVHAIGPSKAGYRYNSRLTPWLRAHANDYDVVIINGLWQYHGLGAWRALKNMGVPYFVFCHGMLDPWFKKTYPLKHLKKWLYWPWAEYRVLRDARAVFFTCEEERLLARKSFWLYKVRERVVAYGAASPPPTGAETREAFYEALPEVRGKRIVLFLGRIQEKKGCDLLIEAFARAAGGGPALHLVMAGPDESGWVSKLQAQAQRLGVADRISWPGTLLGDKKWGAFFAAEVFALTSHQENFGIAVAEALACGLPVLISDKVNIWREIDKDKAGLVEPDTAVGAIRLLQRWIDLDAQERNRMRERARQTYLTRYTARAMACSLLDQIHAELIALARVPQGSQDYPNKQESNPHEQGS